MNKTLRNNSGLALFGLAAALFLLPTVIVLAADGVTSYIPLVSLPGLFTAGKATNPVEIIKGIYGLAIGIGSVIATVMIIYAGFEYMYVESMGQKSAAKERIQNAFWGLLVILGSYILLRTINPSLVEFSLTLPAGTGRLGTLVVADQAALAREKRISDVLKADAAAKAEIAVFQQQASKLDTDIAALEAKKVAAGSNAALVTSIQKDIDDLSFARQNVNSNINQKTIESTGNTLSALLHDGQDSVMTTEINAINADGSNYTTEQALDLIIGRKESTLTRLDNELAKVNALPETPNKAALVNGFTSDINSYKAYLVDSKSLVTDTKQILSGKIQGTGYYNSPDELGLIDTNLNILARQTETKAKAYETAGKIDIANQLRNDLKNTHLIVKAQFSDSCGDKTKTLTMCAQ
jgi:Type IV secretion system pilin